MLAGNLDKNIFQENQDDVDNVMNVDIIVFTQHTASIWIQIIVDMVVDRTILLQLPTVNDDNINILRWL